MADNNIDIDEMQRALENLSRSLNGTASASDSLTASEIASKREMEAYTRKLSEEKEKLGSAFRKTADETLKFTRGVMGSANSFGALNDAVTLGTKVIGGLVGAIPVVGSAFKALGDAAGEVTKMMIDQFQVGWNAYKDLADLGVASSFEDMKSTAASTGLLFQDINKSMGKYVGDLSNLGPGVSSGVKAFKQVSVALQDSRMQFARMGIGIEEFTEYQAKFMAQETRQGRASQMTADQLAKGTKEYIDQLDTLSKLTGQSRKELQNQRDAAQSETRFAAALDQVGPNVKKTFEDLNVLVLNKGGAQLAQAMRDMASGATTTEAARQGEIQSGGALSKIVELVRTGAIDAATAMNMYKNAINGNLKPMGELGQHIGDASLYTKNYSENRKFANAADVTPEDVKNIEKQRNVVKEGTDASVAQNTALAGTTQKLYDASKNLQLLMTSSDFVVKSMDKVAGAMDEMSIKMLEWAGVELPEDLKARKEERKAIQEATAVKVKEKHIDEELIHTRERIKQVESQIAEEKNLIKKKQLEGNLAKLKDSEKFLTGPLAQKSRQEAAAETAAAQKKAEAATAKRQALSGGPIGGTPGASTSKPPSGPSEGTSGGAPNKSSSGPVGDPNGPSAPPGGITKPDLVGIRSKSGKGAQVAKEYAPAFQSLIDALEDSGYKINSLGGYNDRDVRGFDGKKSIHAYGGAIDINPATNPMGPKLITDMPENVAEMASKLGLGWGGNWRSVKDAMHFSAAKSEGGKLLEARNGWQGLIEGPHEGYRPDLELHGKERVTITPENDKTNEKMVHLLEQMIDKYDTMIELLDDNNNNGKKLVNAMA